MNIKNMLFIFGLSFSINAYSQNTMQMMRQSSMMHNQQRRMNEQQRFTHFLLTNNNVGVSLEKQIKKNNKKLVKLDEMSKKLEAEIAERKLELEKSEEKDKVQKKLDDRQAKLNSVQDEKLNTRKETERLEFQLNFTKNMIEQKKKEKELEKANKSKN